MQLRRTLIGVLALLCALATSGSTWATPGINSVGTLDRFPPEAVEAFGPDFIPQSDEPTHFWQRIVGGTLLPVPGVRQVWQLYPSLDMVRTGILVRDADSHRVVHSMILPWEVKRASTDPSGGSEWFHATDGGNRVFLVTRDRHLVEIDATTFDVRDRGQVTVALPILDPVMPGGLAYDAATDSLLVLYGGPANSSVTNRLTVLQRIDLGTGVRSNRVVRSCTGPLPSTDIGSTFAAELLLRSDAVYVTCQRQLRGFIGSPTPEGDDTRALVVRLPRATLWESDGGESSVEAGRRFNAAPVDPDGGRVVVVDLVGRATVVDVEQMSVVGTFDVAPGNTFNGFGLGLDRAAGRFFFQSQLGLGYVDVRSTPLPLPVVDASAAAEGQERIVTRGNRAYVLPGTGIGQDKPDHYTIYNVAP